MIYIKDYRNLNGIAVNSQSYAFRSFLQESLGKTVTVYTTSGGASGRGFTGLLIDVFSDSLRILSNPSYSSQSFSKTGKKGKNEKGFPLGRQTVIRIEHIVAISIAYI